MAPSYVVDARRIRREHWNQDGMISFPIDPFAIAQNLGIRVSDAPLESGTAGFILKERDGPVQIVLNSHDPRNRQRFTLAHEIGHYVQHEGDAEIGFVDKRDEMAASGTDAREVWANRFAAELLMPGAIIKKWWAEGMSSEEIRRKLSVSAPAIAFRLKNLSLL